MPNRLCAAATIVHHQHSLSRIGQNTIVRAYLGLLHKLNRRAAPKKHSTPIGALSTPPLFLSWSRVCRAASLWLKNMKRRSKYALAVYIKMAIQICMVLVLACWRWCKTMAFLLEPICCYGIPATLLCYLLTASFFFID